ncbi:MAG: hypothetical protein Q7U65_04585, partial [Bacteroidota bacterium]|nr:hypothetical protein [Bacteroidota bacterium]
MRTTLTLFCILIASLPGLSQNKNFDLSKYKFPDYKRHELELNLNSSGRSENYYSVIPPTVNYSGTKYDSSNS